MQPLFKENLDFISNIIAYDVTGEQGAIISGMPGHDIEDLTLDNIRFYFKGSGTKEQAAIEVPPLIDSYPDPNWFGIRPAHKFQNERYGSELHEKRPATGLCTK